MPNAPEFAQALQSVTPDTKKRLEDLLRANFKYLEELEVDKPKLEVPSEDDMLEDVAADLLEEED